MLTLRPLATPLPARPQVVWEEMKRQKDEVLSRVGLLGTQQEKLGSQQEKLMKAQEDMDGRLREVSHDVLDVRYTADSIKDDLGQLRDDHASNMTKMDDKLTLATRVR